MKIIKYLYRWLFCGIYTFICKSEKDIPAFTTVIIISVLLFLNVLDAIIIMSILGLDAIQFVNKELVLVLLSSLLIINTLILFRKKKYKLIIGECEKYGMAKKGVWIYALCSLMLIFILAPILYQLK